LTQRPATSAWRFATCQVFVEQLADLADPVMLRFHGVDPVRDA